MIEFCLGLTFIIIPQIFFMGTFGFGTRGKELGSSKRDFGRRREVVPLATYMGVPPVTTPAGTRKLWTRDEITSRILAGETLVICDSQLLRIPPNWLTAHPGGPLAILHFVGRDASDEIAAYHCNETLKRLRGYVIGDVECGPDGWEPLVPPVMSGWVRRPGAEGEEWFQEAGAVRSREDSQEFPPSQILLVKADSEILPLRESVPTLETITPPPTNLSLKVQAQHSAAYKALHTKITHAGLYKTPYLTGYGPEVARYVSLGALSAFAYQKNWLITSAVLLGLTWHQLVFSAHDLGHMGVTHNWAVDRILGTLIADFIGGLSIGWWVENHNIHHLVTNHPSHDPDIEHLPFLAISPTFLSSLFSSFYKRTMAYDSLARWLIPLQHKLFYLIMALSRFNLYMNSYSYLAKNAVCTNRARGGRWTWALEIVGLCFFWWWFGKVLVGCGTVGKAITYLVVSHVATSPLHVQIVLSHFSMSTDDLGPTESFPHRQLRTTTDVICPPSLSFLHGGLHLQVTHHLFPRLPRHNLRKASKLVKEFAREEGLVYAEFGFRQGNRDVVGTLRSVAEQARLVAMVADSEISARLSR